MLTECFPAEHLEATARRTGCGKRASKRTGNLLLAFVTFGVWSDATTTLTPLAAKVTPWDDQLEVAPEARYQRLHQSALAFLPDLIRHALATVQALAPVCDEGLLPAVPTVALAESPGGELPNSFQELFPGSGGSAAQAGANLPAVWDSQSRVGDHGALTPWNMPDPKSRERVVA